MDSLELFLFALLLQLVSQIILFVSWLFLADVKQQEDQMRTGHLKT